jgi:hypothetical protein
MPFPGGPRCPQCLSALPLRSLSRWTPGGYSGLMFGKIGVECPSCGARLRIIQTRVAVTSAILFAVLLFGARGLTSLGHQAHLETTETLQLLGVFTAVIGMLLLPLFAPNLWQVRLVSADEAVAFPLGTPKAEADATPGWVCRQCHEKNPENFELCWNCGHLRAKSTASNHRSKGRDA